MIGRPSRGGVDRNDDQPQKIGIGVVAPLVGAWIETFSIGSSRTILIRRPSRGGVDRNYSGASVAAGEIRRPSRGGVDRNASVAANARDAASRPSRGGVDRNNAARGYTYQSCVAPLVGAWIETVRGCSKLSHAPSRPSRGGVDRNLYGPPTTDQRKSRPSRGGVDRNLVMPVLRRGCGRRPSRGGVDRNGIYAGNHVGQNRRPSRGGVDRNSLSAAVLTRRLVAPLVGAWIETKSTADSPPRESSPLSWGRGSKLYRGRRQAGPEASPLSWGRGSKLYKPGTLPLSEQVAPLVGAWIKTSPQ